MKTPSVRFRIDFTDYSNLGPGKIALLEAVHTSGSLSDAARGMGMSYRRAWLLLDNLNRCFKEPVTVSTTGGRGGGGARVTPFGKTLIKSYRALEEDITQLIMQRLGEIIPHVVPDCRSPSRTARKPLAKRLAKASDSI